MKLTLTLSTDEPDEIEEARRVLDMLASRGSSDQAPSPAHTHDPVTAFPPLPPPALAVVPAPPAPPAAAPPALAVVPPPPAPAPPAPPAAPPSAPPAAGPPAQGGPELDADGQPWDAQLHSSSRKKTKDGRWRRKKGLKGGEAPAAPAPTAPGAPPPPPPPPPPQPAASAPAAPAPAPAPAANGVTTWEQVMAALTARAQRYDAEHVQAALAAAGVERLTLHERPDQYAAAIAALNAHCPV